VTRWSSWLSSFFGLGSKDKPDSPADVAAQPEADAVAGDTEAIRQHLRRVGAALGVAGGALLSGLGYTQVHKIFPFPTDSHRVLLMIGAGLASAAALVGAALLAGRFLGAQRRILVSTDPDEPRGGRRRSPYGLRRRECEIRDRIYDLAARDESAQSLRAVELRGLRFERIARRVDPKKAPAWKDESKRLQEAVKTALDQGALTVLEHRARQAFSGRLTVLAFLVTIVGIIGVFGLADWSQGQRDLVTLEKQCVEAKTAVPACKRFGAGATKPEAAPGESPWLNGFRVTVLKRRLVGYRVYGGGSSRKGVWLTTILPVSEARARSRLALPEENSAHCIVRVEIPSQTTVRMGHAAPLFNQPGGAAQVQIQGALDKIVFEDDKALPPSKGSCP